MSNFLLDPGSEKTSYRRHYWDNWTNVNMNYLLDNGTVSM